MRLVRFLTNTELQAILQSAGKSLQVIEANLCAFNDGQIRQLNMMVGTKPEAQSVAEGQFQGLRMI
jgi:hypothetical protein